MNRALIPLLVGVALFVAGYFTGTKAEHNANEAEKKHAQDVATELHNAKSIVGERVEHVNQALFSVGVAGDIATGDH